MKPSSDVTAVVPTSDPALSKMMLLIRAHWSACVRRCGLLLPGATGAIGMLIFMLCPGPRSFSGSTYAVPFFSLNASLLPIVEIASIFRRQEPDTHKEQHP